MEQKEKSVRELQVEEQLRQVKVDSTGSRMRNAGKPEKNRIITSLSWAGLLQNTFRNVMAFQNRK